jgi:hypothetical protein
LPAKLLAPAPEGIIVRTITDESRDFTFSRP